MSRNPSSLTSCGVVLSQPLLAESRYFAATGWFALAKGWTRENGDVAGRLPQEAQNAPLHLFSASPELVGFGQGAYRQRSEWTSRILGELFEESRGESFAMPYTIEDFERDYFLKHFPKLHAKSSGKRFSRCH